MAPFCVQSLSLSSQYTGLSVCRDSRNVVKCLPFTGSIVAERVTIQWFGCAGFASPISCVHGTPLNDILKLRRRLPTCTHSSSVSSSAWLTYAKSQKLEYIFVGSS